MIDRLKLSHYKLVKLLRCGELFRRDEEEREYAPPTSAMVRGTAVHAVASQAHLAQIRGKEAHPDWPRSMALRESLPSEEEAADMAATKFEAEAREQGIVADRDDEDVDAPPRVIIGKDKDSAVRLSRFYVSRHAPFIDPIASEVKLSVEPKDLPVRISGIIDLISQDTEGRVSVRDIKTAYKAPSKDEAHESDQLTLYAALQYFRTGKLPDSVALDYFVDTRRFLGSPYRIELVSERTHADIDVMVNRMNAAIDTVKAGVFLPAPPGSWYCSPRFCKFWSSCRYVSSARLGKAVVKEKA